MRREGWFVLVFIFLKLAFLAWNSALFDGEIYDQKHHLWRLQEAGFITGKMAYNGPLYYVPAWAYLELAEWEWVAPPRTRLGKQSLMQVVRATNIGWLAIFYASWIYGIFPRVTADRRTWFAASVVLLSLPGYQKVGTLVHPDNMLAAGTAAGFALWLLLRQRTRDRGRWEGALVLLIGVLGSVRPFALVPIGVLWAGLMRTSKVGRSLTEWVPRAMLYTIVSVSLAGGWLGYRAYHSDVVLDAYNHKYMAPYEKHREGFDFTEYFTSFYLTELLETPNRNNTRAYKGNRPRWENPIANSFWTTAYSEFWADHWLYLSGPRLKERKKPEKQRLLTAALPYSALLLGRFGWGLGAVGAGAVKAARTRTAPDPQLEVQLTMAALLFSGAALFLYWQTGSGLLPGKHSTIKFLYTAHLVPFGIALCFAPAVRWHWAWGAAAAAITAISVPYLLFLPSWW